MEITYKNIISAEEVNFLRAYVGFRQILPEQIRNGLDGSTLIAATYDQQQIVGMARLIWDGGKVLGFNSQLPNAEGLPCIYALPIRLN